MFSNCAWDEPRRKEYAQPYCFRQSGCWSPCIWYHNLKNGSYACLAYTLVMHILAMSYTISVMKGDRSAEFYSPFFLFDKTSMLIATSLTIIYMLLFGVFCLLLYRGLYTNNRFLFWPWMLGMVLEITLMISYGLWLLARYWSFSPFHFIPVVILCIFCAFHIYCLQCVVTHFKLLGDEFKVDILYPDYDEWP